MFLSRRAASPPAAGPWTPADQLPPSHSSEVLPGLFMGGDSGGHHGTDSRDPALIVSTPFDTVVTLYAQAQPAAVHVEELRYGFADGTMALIDVERLLRTAQWARARWRSGDRVLVRCQAGLNRSGLVVCLVLMLEGLSPTDAIATVRQRRSPMALCNQGFVQWLTTDAAAVVAASTASDRVA